MTAEFSIRKMTRDAFAPLFLAHVDDMFEGDHSYTLGDVISTQEADAMNKLEARLEGAYTLYLGAFDADGTFIGWSFGRQESKTTFYMINSAVFPAHRRKGIYSALIREGLAHLTKEGFQTIYSRHVVTNNAVLIPKLKAGFVISKMEVDDVHGVLVHLQYLTNDARKRILDYRAGLLAPDAAVRDVFKI